MVAGQAARDWLGYDCSIGIHAVGLRAAGWRAPLRFATTAAVSGCELLGSSGVGMQLESERAGGVFVKGYQNVADGSEAATNYSGVRIMRTPAL